MIETIFSYKNQEEYYIVKGYINSNNENLVTHSHGLQRMLTREN